MDIQMHGYHSVHLMLSSVGAAHRFGGHNGDGIGKVERVSAASEEKLPFW
jgi:hypothetical protein